jgi:hypothetical protein
MVKRHHPRYQSGQFLGFSGSASSKTTSKSGGREAALAVLAPVRVW